MSEAQLLFYSNTRSENLVPERSAAQLRGGPKMIEVIAAQLRGGPKMIEVIAAQLRGGPKMIEVIAAQLRGSPKMIEVIAAQLRGGPKMIELIECIPIAIGEGHSDNNSKYYRRDKSRRSNN